ncbi:MAG: cupredoxin domain-containing protein [Methanomicrobiales archaeon]|nr:cupredoxin domain-containing protein [Methanomicrobiales archaeon]MDD1657451.1 cupredoxin domain-containing protein [Methanomicrobiales archaeon]
MAERIALKMVLPGMLVLVLLLAAGCTGTGSGEPGTVTTTATPPVTTIVGESPTPEPPVTGTTPVESMTPEPPVTETTAVESVAEVLIRNFAFEPASLTISAGTTVIWTNEDSAPHQVASDPHPAHTDLPELVSDTLSSGDSYRFTFVKTGTYGYHCHLHPTMKGTIVVEE